MVAMWAIALGIVVVQRDLGAALLFFAVFLALLYVATAPGELRRHRARPPRSSACFVAYELFRHVRTRIDIWLDPFADPPGAGYQVVQALHAFARGGLLGTGLGGGLPMIGGRLPIPALHTDFPLAALGEELGLVGVLAILGIYLVHRRARPAHRGGGGGRLPRAPGDRPVPGRSASRPSSSPRATSS